MFELGSGRQGDLVAHDGQLVLHKATINTVDLLVRQEVDAHRSLNEVARAYARSQPPGQLLVAVDQSVLHEVDVKCISSFSQFEVLQVGAIEICLKLDVGALSGSVLPAR